MAETGLRPLLDAIIDLMPPPNARPIVVKKGNEGEEELPDSDSGPLHPTSEDVAVPMINYFANGSLQDGGSFYVHALLVEGRATQIRIILD